MIFIGVKLKFPILIVQYYHNSVDSDDDGTDDSDVYGCDIMKGNDFHDDDDDDVRD